eukprot:gene22872-biopygen31502
MPWRRTSPTASTSGRQPFVYDGTDFQSWDNILTATTIDGMMSTIPLTDHKSEIYEPIQLRASLTILKFLIPCIRRRVRELNLISDPIAMMNHIRSEYSSPVIADVFIAHKHSTQTSKNWIRDTGATHHMTGNLDLLYDI